MTTRPDDYAADADADVGADVGAEASADVGALGAPVPGGDAGSNGGDGLAEGVTESFGGESTPVVPDDAPSSRWDRNAQDEDALIADGPQEA